MYLIFVCLMVQKHIYDLTYTIELNFETRESFDEFISYEYDRFSYIEVYSYKDYSVFWLMMMLLIFIIIKKVCHTLAGYYA